MKTLLIIFLSIFTLLAFAQNLTAEEILNQSIQYHDPNANWPTFNDDFVVTMETPNKPSRRTEIEINLPKENFKAIATRDSKTTSFIIQNGQCFITKSDSIRIANQTEKPKRTHCELTDLYKNYYTYLYGLPMKLKDKGTNLSETVERKIFKGKEYLVLKVTYDEAVGSDIWYFYFNPKTFAMEVYQFYKTDENGRQKPNTGEYILLDEITEINSIKMPKNRTWYYNKNDELLGTDVLTKE